jgi:serine protease Do
MSTSRAGIWAVAVILAGSMLGCGPDAAMHAAAASRTETESAPAASFVRAVGSGTQAAAALQTQVDQSRRTAIVLAAERVAPAVVTVNVRRRERAQPQSLYESFFFGPYEREVSGLGSGFIVAPEGIVITNDHVVRGAERVTVALADGREFDAEILGTDELNDLAVLRLAGVGASTLPAAPLGSSDGLLIGEWVVAIGNPFGFLMSNPEPTVTVGVVSGVGRNILPGGSEDSGYYLDMIQTDASINPGNSGGPLVNALGEVVGVNSSIISRSGGSQGLGFAIPINRARRIADDLLREGRVRRAWVGIYVDTVQTQEPGRRRTLRVAHVVPESPAAAAGVRAGMLLESVNGRSLRTPLDWEARLLEARVGESLRMSTFDGRTQRTFDIVPSDLPSLTAERIRALADFELVTLTPAIRAERGFVSERGAVIVGLSEAARRDLGLREGDLIVQIGREPVTSAPQAADYLRRLAGQGFFQLYFERNGQLLMRQLGIR